MCSNVSDATSAKINEIRIVIISLVLHHDSCLVRRVHNFMNPQHLIILP